MPEWNRLSDAQQLELAAAALQRASEALAALAENLAEDIGSGAIADRGGREALCLFAGLVRAVHEAPVHATVGHC